MKKYISLLFGIIISILLIPNIVKASSYNPRYVLHGTNAQAGSVNLYIYTEGRLYPNRLPLLSIDNFANARLPVCVTPSYYSSSDSEQLNAYWLEISVCTTGVENRNGWWQSSGNQYASLTGVVNYTNRSCYTGNYNGYVQKVYVHLLDWVTPSGGADFSWSCFELAQDNYGSGYHNESKILDFQLVNDNNYDNDKDQQTIINQNQQTINNQNTQINNQQTIINQNNATQDLIKDESAPNMSSLSNSAGWLPPGPVDSILNLPLTFLQSLYNAVSGSCNPVILPVPYINYNFELPCISTIFDGFGVTSLWNTIGLIASGFILYSYLTKLYKWVDDTLSFRENNHIDNWGGI